MYLSRHFGNPSYEIIPLSCFLSLVIVESNELTPRSVMTNWQLDRLYSRRETGGVIGSNSDRMVCVCVCVGAYVHFIMCARVCVCVSWYNGGVMNLEPCVQLTSTLGTDCLVTEHMISVLTQRCVI